MPLPPIKPPFGSRVVDARGYMTPEFIKFFDVLWRKTGAETMNAPLIAEQAVAIPPTVTSVGAPTMPSTPGVYAVDSVTGDIYYNPTGAGGDWFLL